MKQLSLLLAICCLVGCTKNHFAPKPGGLKLNASQNFEVFKVENNRALDANLFIYFTNQSPIVDPVDFSVYIDNDFAFSVKMPFENGSLLESYGLSVESGERRVRVVSKSGKTFSEKTITVDERKFMQASFYVEDKQNGSITPRLDLIVNNKRFSMH